MFAKSILCVMMIAAVQGMSYNMPQLPKDFRMPTPRFEAPQAPRFEAPRYAAPEAPRFEAPRYAAPEAPRFAAPEAPRFEAPRYAAPEAPRFAAPEAPRFEAPRYAAPEAPRVVVPEAPRMERPTYSAPKAPEAPRMPTYSAPKAPEAPRMPTYSAPEAPKVVEQTYSAPAAPQLTEEINYEGIFRAQLENLKETCEVGTTQPIWEGFEIVSSYCRCPTGTYGITCYESFVNPCIETTEEYFPADMSLAPSFYVKCDANMPFLAKCPEGLVWNNSIQSCDWEHMPYVAPRVADHFAPILMTNGGFKTYEAPSAPSPY